MSELEGLFFTATAGVKHFTSLFANPSYPLGFIPLFLTLLIVVFLCVYRAKKSGGETSIATLRREVFPKEVYGHPSARRDCVVFFLNEAVFFYFESAVGIITLLALQKNGAHFAAEQALLPKAIELVLLSIYFALAIDFFSTLAHYLKHKVPVLWEFHKAHHSAPVMTPVSAMRRHPVDMMVNGFVINGGVAIALLAWSYAFQSSLQPWQIFGASIAVFAWRMTFYNLRHSHIWLDYGPFWGRIFISPAHHHIHHSNSPEHYDRNFGLIFAFWDRLFGTLYMPDKAEKIEFGIDPDEMKDFDSLAGIYLSPFVKVGRMLRQGARPAASSVSQLVTQRQNQGGG